MFPEINIYHPIIINHSIEIKNFCAEKRSSSVYLVKQFF